MNRIENIVPDKLAYSVREAVMATGLSRSSLYRAIKGLKLKSRRVGGRRVIMTDHLLEFLRGTP